MSPNGQTNPQTTRSEIIEIINSLKSKKAPGYDLLNPMILKNLPARAIEFRMHLFNACLIRSYFPEQWQAAEIIMIPKPGQDAKMVQSYRPICLLTSLSKVVQILFLKRLLPIIEHLNLIPKHQF